MERFGKVVFTSEFSLIPGGSSNVYTAGRKKHKSSIPMEMNHTGASLKAVYLQKTQTKTIGLRHRLEP